MLFGNDGLGEMPLTIKLETFYYCAPSEMILAGTGIFFDFAPPSEVILARTETLFDFAPPSEVIMTGPETSFDFASPSEVVLLVSTDDYYPLLEKLVVFDSDVLGWVLLTYLEIVTGKYSLY